MQLKMPFFFQTKLSDLHSSKFKQPFQYLLIGTQEFNHFGPFHGTLVGIICKIWLLVTLEWIKRRWRVYLGFSVFNTVSDNRQCLVHALGKLSGNFFFVVASWLAEFLIKDLRRFELEWTLKLWSFLEFSFAHFHTADYRSYWDDSIFLEMLKFLKCVAFTDCISYSCLLGGRCVNATSHCLEFCQPIVLSFAVQYLSSSYVLAAKRTLCLLYSHRSKAEGWVISGLDEPRRSRSRPLDLWSAAKEVSADAAAEAVFLSFSFFWTSF